MPSINRQARQPVTNADTKPATITPAEIPVAAASPALLMRSSRASPRIGGSTIRNENCATTSRLLPSSRPVAIVVPERDRPGIAATACAQPMIHASRHDNSLFSRSLARAAKVSRAAVTSNISPTMSIITDDESIALSWSLNAKPTIPIGIIDSTILAIYSVCELRSKRNNPRTRSQICLRRTTIVLNTVAAWSVTSKVRFSTISTPSNSLAICR